MKRAVIEYACVKALDPANEPRACLIIFCNRKAGFTITKYDYSRENVNVNEFSTGRTSQFFRSRL